MKIAFVLSGGGAKGAYEIGFLKAMEELDIYPDIVTRTSIGALNGCLIAQKDFQIAYELWQNITVEQVIKDGFSINYSLDSWINNTNLILPFFKSFVNYKGANITPLIDLIKRLCNEEKLKKSNVDFGLVTVEFPSLKSIEITKKKFRQAVWQIISSLHLPVSLLFQFIISMVTAILTAVIMIIYLSI